MILRAFCAGLAAALACAANAATPMLSGDATDLWWSPNASGRGVNVVQQGNTAFVTFFIYDAEGRAHWYVGSNLQAPAFARPSDTDTRFEGPLYESTGPAFGQAFNPAQVVLRQVGTARLQVFRFAGANLHFSIDGKEDEWWLGRQTWAAKNIAGKYNLTRVEQGTAGCAASTHVVDLNESVITQNGADVTITTSHGTPSIFSCTFNGAYSQAGRLSQVQGSYHCSDNTAGPFTISDLESGPAGLLGHFFADVNGCAVTGNIGGTRDSISSAAAEVTDLWWNPNEAGWGVNLMEQSGAVFATFFVYDADRKPHWYVASDMRASGTRFSGALYETIGPAFASSFPPFDASRVTTRAVGMATFDYAPPSQGTLTYSIDGVTVSKSLTRQSWAANDVSGRYRVSVVEQGSNGCFPFPGFVNLGDAMVTVSGSSVTLTSGTNGAACVYTGTYSQAGHMGTITGTRNCGGGNVGPFTMNEVSVSPYGFLARLNETASGCNMAGNIGGVRLDITAR